MNILKDINVKKQLIFCFMSVIVVFTIANIFTIYTIQNVGSTSKEANHKYVKGLNELNKVDVNFGKLGLEVSRLSHTYIRNDNQVINDLQHHILMLENSIDEYYNFLHSINDVTRMDMFLLFKDSFHNEYMVLLYELETSINSEDINIINEALSNVITYGDELSILISDLLNYNINVISELSDTINFQVNLAFYVTLIITFCAVFLSLLIAIISGRSFSKRIINLSDSANRIANGDLDAAPTIESRDELGILSKNINVIASTLKSITKDIKDLGNDHEIGKITVEIDPSKYKGGFSEIVISINSTVKGLTKDMDTFLHIVEEFSQGNFEARIPPLPGEKAKFNKVSDAMRENLTSINKEIAQLIDYANKGDLTYRSYANFSGDWRSIILGLNLLMSAIENPINEVISILTEMSKGNFDKEITTDYKGDFAIIKDSINSTSKTLRIYIKEISDTLNKMANNDLDVTITNEYVGDFMEIKNAINTIVNKLNKVFNDFNTSADQVLDGAKQMSESNLYLSQGATSQLESVHTLNDIIEEISKQIEISVEKSKEISQLSLDSKADASIGDKAMKDMLGSMEKISNSSKSIEQIINVIDDIAFQTNLLALNAAVEAARAGEHGKGFAVVAEEVRNLAARSQKAAKQTNELILSSLKDVSEGTELAISTDKALSLIVSSIEKMSEIITEVSELSNKQSIELVKINSGIQEVSTVVDNNAASAEEGAASSEELSSQSASLKDMIGAFNLKK